MGEVVGKKTIQIQVLLIAPISIVPIIVTFWILSKDIFFGMGVFGMVLLAVALIVGIFYGAFGLHALLFPRMLVTIDDNYITFAKPRVQIKIDEIKSISSRPHLFPARSNMWFPTLAPGTIIITTKSRQKHKQKYVAEAMLVANALNERIRRTTS